MTTAAADALAVAAFSLARRLADHATLWCVAPEWPEHAWHVAVEFVHPVIVGKRALPAVSVEAADPVAVLRPLVRPGDVVLVVGPASSAVGADLVRRAAAWGATSVWLGAGARPAPGAADHVLWEDDAVAVHDGRLVLLYHVLWELTHVCFEHPGLLVAPAGCNEEVCVTCSDEGRLGEVVTAGADGPAEVRTARGVEWVDTTLVDDVDAGDLVLIHAGAAIAIVA